MVHSIAMTRSSIPELQISSLMQRRVLFSNPFTESGTTTAEAVVASIKTAEGKLIPQGEALNNFRNNNKIEVFRAGSMYYYYPIQDNTYKTATTFSVLRNSIYQLNVTKISEVGKDIPNGPTPDDDNLTTS